MYVLGIETSCDETAAAIVAYDGVRPQVVANVVHTQLEHLDYGGVIPEIAARAHLEKLEPLVRRALEEAGLALAEVDGIAATAGPGLLGGLLVGVSFAKTLAMAAEKPYIAINHLEGHALSPRLAHDVPFPYLLLLASGGHCQFLHVKGVGDYTLLGATQDDAAGEAFDKVAKLLGLPYPGGPAIEKLAKQGNPEACTFPIPMQGRGLDMSFSGLKTAVRQLVVAESPLSDQRRADIAASFQATVAKTLADKTKAALKASGAVRFVVAGGVAANQAIRSTLQRVCDKAGATFSAPPLALCTDNAAMIAYAGALRLAAGATTPLAAGATPSWPLNTLEKVEVARK